MVLYRKYDSAYNYPKALYKADNLSATNWNAWHLFEPFENEKCKNTSLQFNISTLLTNPTWYMYKSTETKTVNSNMTFQAKYLSNITNIQSWAIKARIGPKSVDPLLIKLVPFPLF